ncbi:MAG TPA: ABC transporter permease [Streptosporangiaceae bacterium]|nr:ABC transporter permease [Streptosporangiaceae bacterium]
MIELTGTGTLTRFILRRDRLRILVWIGSIFLLEYMSAASTKGIYHTQADLDKAAAAVHGNAAAIALNGPDQALDTMGGQIVFQIGTFGLVLVALMAIFMIGRETRLEEETGRAEFIRAMAVGRHASAAAALIVVSGMSAAVGALETLSLLSLDVPAEGSVLFGVSSFVLGLVFAGVALVAAQLTENTRVALGGAGAVVGAAYVLRAAGDIGDGNLTWLSPIGWAQKTRPFAGDRWWPLIISAVAAAALIAAGAVLSTRRDVDAGFVRPRPGRRVAAPSLGRPLGLAVRLQRAALIWWSIAMFLTGAAYGWIANDVEDFVGDNEAMQEVMNRLGGASLVDSYLSMVMFMVALVAAGFAVQSTLRLRGEESALHAEPVLATPVSRGRWIVSHLTIALAGSVIVLAAGGLGCGLVYGITIGDLGQVPRMIGVALAYAPALWLLAGIAMLLFGAVPRGAAIAWGAFAACFVIGLLGEIFEFPGWVLDASPFQHIPQLPGASLTIVPLAVLTAASAALAGAGLLAFHRRDAGY